MTSYYNPSKWLSEYAAALLSPYIKLENEGGDNSSSGGQKETNPTQKSSTPSSSLSVGLWSGNVELKNVELRPEAFEQFLNCKESNDTDDNESAAQIKWKLVQGSVDSVKIQIPWKSLLVGTAHSSSKCSASDDGGINQKESQKDRPTEPTKKVQEGDGADDPPASYASGCTTIQIQGVKLLLGYEVIHHNPMLNTLQQCQQSMNNTESSNPYSGQERPENQLQKKIREEKNRILQIAERRLLAGLDPFPPSLMEGLQSIIASSMFQQSAAIVHSTVENSTDGDDNASVVTSNTQDTVSSPIKSYRSMMGNYLSSTIKSLLWSVFDSLSLSVTEVKLSVVGSSHYDKDFVSLLRKEREKAEGEGRGEANNEKILEQQKMKQELQKKKKNIRKRDFRNAAAARSLHRLHLRSSYGRSSTNSSVEEDEDAENNDHTQQQQQQSRRESISEDPSIWAREGHVEMGITLDRFDVKPGPLTSTDDGVKIDSVALKLVQFQGVGVFVRRKCPMISKDGGAWENYVNDASSGLHTGKTLVWNDMEVDDYVVLPANMDASCKVYRNSSGSTSAKLDASSSSSPQKRKAELSDVHSKTSGVDTKSTTNTKRRGKRDKRKKGAEPVPATLQRGHSVLSAGTIPSTATATSGRGTRGDVFTKGDPSYDYDSFTPPNRLELCLEMGHVRSSVSPRQLFLLHSFSSSMTRAKRGRPPITIRAAQAHDKSLIERMTEERQSMLAWEERIYREAPLLRSRSSRQSMRSLPGVVLSWWRYAFFNIVHEIQERKALLDRCSGDSISKEVRGNRENIFTRSIGFQCGWDWTTQSRIRKEYIDLYVIAHKPTTASPAYDAAAVAAAKLRLEQIEDDLSVERVLLLKHVAQAASISERPDNVQPTSIKSSSAYYNLRPRALKEEDSLADGNVLQSLSPLGYDSGATHLSLSPSALKLREANAPLAASTKKLDKEGHTIQNTTISSGSKEPRDTPSFSAQFFLSGFSLAVCDFSLPDGTDMEYEVGQYSRPYQTDDISVLTDCFHDDEDGSKAPKRVAYGGESFDPACRFWPTTRHGIYCGSPIVLLHIADITFSAQSLASDKLHPPHVENEFSVGGISVQYGISPSKQSIFCLGYVPQGDEPRTKLIPNQSVGVSGCFGSSRNNSALRIGPAEINIDYGWLEHILRFAKANTGIRPSNSTVPLKYEDLLVRAVSKNSTNHNISATLEFDRLSVTIPVHRTADSNDDKNDKLFLITTVNQLHIKTGKLYDSSRNASDKIAASVMENDLFSSQDLVRLFSGFEFEFVFLSFHILSYLHFSLLLFVARCSRRLRHNNSETKQCQCCKLENYYSLVAQANKNAVPVLFWGRKSFTRRINKRMSII